MPRRHRRWTASSLAKQYRECLDAGDRACARDAAERIQRSDSRTARAVVASAREHGLLGLRGRGKRALGFLPPEHLRALERGVAASRETELVAEQLRQIWLSSYAGEDVGPVIRMAAQVPPRLHDARLVAETHADSVIRSRLATPAQKRRARELLQQQRAHENLALNHARWLLQQRGAREHLARQESMAGTKARKRGLRGTPPEHATQAWRHLYAAHEELEWLLHGRIYGRAGKGHNPASKAKLVRSIRRHVDQGAAECSWARGEAQTRCEAEVQRLDAVLAREGLGGVRKKALGAVVVVRRGKSYEKVEPSTRRAASNPFRDELAPGQHEQTRCQITVLDAAYRTKAFPSTKAGFRQAREYAASVPGAEVSMRCGSSSARMARVIDGELVIERSVSVAKKALKFRGQR